MTQSTGRLDMGIRFKSSRFIHEVNSLADSQSDSPNCLLEVRSH